MSREKGVQFVVDDFCDYFDDGDVFGEVSDAVDVDVQTVFFVVFPVLCCCVLLFDVGDKLSGLDFFLFWGQD